MMHGQTKIKTGNILQHSILSILDPPPTVKQFNPVWSHSAIFATVHKQ